MKRRILIIDDDNGFLEKTKNTLDKTGYQVDTLDNLNEAIKEAIKIKPDLIILDLSLPQKKAFEITSEFRNFSELQRVPIIATDESAKNKKFLFFNDLYGVNGFIRKPFMPLDIISRIERILS